MCDKHVIDDKYRELARVLSNAMEQASGGKGKERHADGERFENQKILVINRWLHGSPIAGMLFQAVKKAVESSRMTYTAAIRELYGAINYLAAGVLLLEELLASEKQMKEPEPPLQIENNTICLPHFGLPELVSEAEVNAEVRRIEKKALAFIEATGGLSLPSRSHADGPSSSWPREGPQSKWPRSSCGKCFYEYVLTSDMPCKKCVDKPFLPHFTESSGPRYQDMPGDARPESLIPA